MQLFWELGLQPYPPEGSVVLQVTLNMPQQARSAQSEAVPS